MGDRGGRSASTLGTALRTGLRGTDECVCRHTSGGRRMNLSRGTGSFLDAAKYFSLGVCDAARTIVELQWVGAKPWWMQGFLAGASEAATWPAGCIFLMQPDAQDSMGAEPE